MSRYLTIGLTAMVLVVWVGLSTVSGQNDRTSLFAGTLTTSTTATVLAASQPVFEVLVQSDPDNTVDILVGTRQAQVIQLKPGQALTIPTSNLDRVYATAASSTPVLNYIARGQ